MMPKLHLAVVIISVAAFLIPKPAAAQSIVTGYWNPLLHQDAAPYANGPDPGDFDGLPITEAARKVAQQYDADRELCRNCSASHFQLPTVPAP